MQHGLHIEFHFKGEATEKLFYKAVEIYEGSCGHEERQMF